MIFPYKAFTIGFSVVVYVWHTFLDVRQLKAIKIPESPASMSKFIKPSGSDEFRKTQAYNLDKWWYSLVHGLWSIVLNICFLAWDGLPWLWSEASRIVARFGFAAASEVQTSVVFVLLFSTATTLLDVPWNLYSTFVIEARHGFNKQTLRLFCADFIKSALLGLALAPPLISIFTWILLHSGQWLVAYVWVFTLAIQLIALTVYPTMIAPLFNKFESLPKGPLREAIEQLAGSLQFPLKKLFVIDGSTRSAHSNAYMYGLGNNKRIVLFDTLLDQCNTDQIVAVLAHELGHWKLGHIIRNLIMMQAVLICQMGLFTLVQHNDQMLADFGFVARKPVLISFVLFTFLLLPLDEVLGFGSNALSRRYEFQADAFAVDLGKGQGLKEGLLKLESSNRSAPNVDRLYSMYHYSHPPVPERLEAIENRMKKAK